MIKRFFTLSITLITLIASAQYNYRDSNRIGIMAGINQFTLYTDNFEASPGTGWNAGLSLRGNFYNNWDMVYAMQFSENNFTVATKNGFLKNEEVEYTLPSAQISLMFSYKIIESHLSVELGPVFQINGQFKIEEQYEENTINGTTLYAKDITDISNFNFYPAVGITAGVTHFRFNVQYQYGLTNMLDSLNNSETGISDLKGNAGIVSGNLIVYL